MRGNGYLGLHELDGLDGLDGLNGLSMKRALATITGLIGLNLRSDDARLVELAQADAVTRRPMGETGRQMVAPYRCAIGDADGVRMEPLLSGSYLGPHRNARATRPSADVRSVPRFATASLHSKATNTVI